MKLFESWSVNFKSYFNMLSLFRLFIWKVILCFTKAISWPMLKLWYFIHTQDKNFLIIIKNATNLCINSRSKDEVWQTFFLIQWIRKWFLLDKIINHILLIQNYYFVKFRVISDICYFKYRNPSSPSNKSQNITHINLIQMPPYLAAPKPKRANV